MFNSQNMKTSNEKDMRTQYIGIGIYQQPFFQLHIKRNVLMYHISGLLFISASKFFNVLAGKETECNKIQYFTDQGQQVRSSRTTLVF